MPFWCRKGAESVMAALATQRAVAHLPSCFPRGYVSCTYRCTKGKPKCVNGLSSSSTSRLQMGATCGECSAAGAGVMTASQAPAYAEALCDFHPGVCGSATFSIPNLAPFLNSRWWIPLWNPPRGGNSGIADVFSACCTTSSVSGNWRPWRDNAILATSYRSCGLDLCLPLSESRESALPDIECKSLCTFLYSISELIWNPSFYNEQ